MIRSSSLLFGLFVSAQALGLTVSAADAGSLKPGDLIEMRDSALDRIAREGEAAAIEALGDPANGALSLEDYGLHTWAFDDQGTIVWDHSGQAEAGMSLSGIQGINGTGFVDDVRRAVAEGEDLTLWESEIPHPVTSQITPAYLSCGTYAESKYVCAMAWFDEVK